MSKRIRRRVTQLLSSRLGLFFGLLAAGTLLVVALVALTLTRDQQFSSLNRQLDEHIVAFQEGPAAAVGTPDDLAPVAGAWLGTQTVPEGQVIIVRTVRGERSADSPGCEQKPAPQARPHLPLPPRRMR